MRKPLFLLALTTTLGCPTPGSDTGSPLTGQPDTSLDSFFSLERVHDLQIQLDEQGWQDLLEQPQEYTQADVTLDGVTYSDVGLRLKGGAGSFIPLDGDYPEISQDGNGNPGKSGFIIKFDKFVDDQLHLGLEKLTVNNLVQDDSGIHETLGYSMWREAGVPAPRTAYTDISLNDSHKGLYLLLESEDNDSFLEDWYDDNDGNIYEGQYGCDLREESVEGFDQDNGDDESREDLYQLVELLEEVSRSEGDEAYELLRSAVDLDEYLAFAASEIYLGHWDGYAVSANNYKVHHHEDGEWTFMPWGADQLFEESFGGYAGVLQEPGPAWHGGRIHELCFDIEPCRYQLFEAFHQVMDRVEQQDLPGLADQARELVGERLLEESTAHGDPEMTQESWDQVERYLVERPDQVLRWLPCLAGEPVDHDGDGFDGCTVDPDDDNPEIGG